MSYDAEGGREQAGTVGTPVWQERQAGSRASSQLFSLWHHPSHNEEGAETQRANRNVPKMTLLISVGAGVSEGLYKGISGLLGIMVDVRRRVGMGEPGWRTTCSAPGSVPLSC